MKDPRKMRMVHESEILNKLHIGLVEEIFVRLPIKYLLRCKGVCKPWYDAITAPKFSKYYVKRSPFTWVIGAVMHKSESIDLLEMNGDRCDTIKYAYNAQKNMLTLQVVSSCNGLCCVVGYTRNITKSYPAIFNPTTGEYEDIPQGEKTLANDTYFVYGFGFCRFIRRYKVVRIGKQFIPIIQPTEYKIVGEIFTLGVDNDWRDFEDPYFPLEDSDPFVSYNGSAHWLGDCKKSASICAFNFEEEKSWRLAFPHGFEFHSNIKLTVLDDHLGLVTLNDRTTHIWVMKEYGVAESWTKHIILEDPFPFDVGSPITPITLLKDGRLLFQIRIMFSLVAFDRKEKKFDRSNKVLSKLHSPFPYVPNFSSLRDVIAEGLDDTTVKGRDNA